LYDLDAVFANTKIDCLYLNVFTPVSATLPNAAPLGVLVWTYGGSFVFGGINLFLYEASKLAAQGIVVVALNYRLGPFGWVFHNDFTKEDANYPTSGNYGLMDQQMALKWIQKNIATFGGDPTRVTLSGESAGSVLTCLQMLLPSSAGLLTGAILQSGPCVQGNVGKEQTWSKQAMIDRTNSLMAAMNCTTSTCLRNTDANAVCTSAALICSLLLHMIDTHALRCNR
jgi:para-nitrobenzyl esterase